MKRHDRQRIAIVVLAGLIVIAGSFGYDALRRLTAPSRLANRVLAPSSLILDRNGSVLYRLMDPQTGVHRPLSLDQVPLPLRQAIVATEDASFYRNPGIDLRSIVRAAWLNLRAGTIVSGGSTITQQVARNLMLGPKDRWAQTWQRKAREATLALSLTLNLSKDDILALYLNQTYFGHLAYGVDAAARAYFGKPVGQLDLAECALLAGLPQAPSLYDPLTNLPAAKERQRTVLDLMVKHGILSAQQADLAYDEPLAFAASPFDIQAPHFTMMVMQQLEQELGPEVLRRGGLTVHTTLDLGQQQLAERTVGRQIARLNRSTPEEPSHRVRNAAVVALEVPSGAVRALVGSPDYFDARNDGAVNATLSLRQPGSAIKPLTYAAALEQGYTLASIMPDVESSFVTKEGRPYQPVNYDYAFHGPVSLRRALACSYNVATVHLYQQLGLVALPDMASRLGITTLQRHADTGLALTLGSGEVQLLQLSAAYGVLANQGLSFAPYLIERVENSQGQVLYQAPQAAPRRLLDERIAYLLGDVLSDDAARVPAFGRGSVLELPFQAAVKTGTTTDWRDNWTVGYSSQFVVGVWTGNADAEPMLRVSGVSGAAPIWRAIMLGLHPQDPADLTHPAGLVQRLVCAESGQLASEACPHRQIELFLAENVPTQRCTMHRLVTVDRRTGQLASADLAPALTTQRVVTLWPPEVLAWAEKEGLAPTSLWPSHEAQAGAAPTTSRQGLAIVRPANQSRYALSDRLAPKLQMIEVEADVAPAMRHQTIALFVDDQYLLSWNAPPYRTLWALTPGRHVLQLVAGEQQSTASAPVTVHVIQENGSTAQ
jgi:1A family penicillin-binding protein